MDHEHFPGCGHVPDDQPLHEAHEHHHDHAKEQLGRCACGSTTFHAEHQFLAEQNLMNFNETARQLSLSPEKDDDTKDKKKEAKSKAKSKEKDNKRDNKNPRYFQLGRLGAKAA